MDRNGDPPVVGVGAGILGCSIAVHLVDRGVRPVLIDPERPGQGTSTGSFASVSALGKDPASWFQLACAGMSGWTRFAERLGGDVGLRRAGEVRWAADPDAFAPEALEEYVRCFSDPAAIHASCEDYRAGAGVDDQLDAAEIGRRRIACPVLVLWGDDGIARRAEDPLASWRPWCDDLRGQGVPGGHFLPEESPAETLAALERFFSEGR